MSEKTIGVLISQLPHAGEVQDDDLLEVERDGESSHITVADFANYLGLDDFAEAIMEILG